MPRFLLFILLAVMLPLAATAADTVAIDSEAEALIDLQQQTADATETLAFTMETEVNSEDSSNTVTAHMWMDKVNNRMRVQQLNAQGEPRIDMMVEGSRAYMKMTDGQWHEIPIDDATKTTLEEMGVDFSQDSDNEVQG